MAKPICMEIQKKANKWSQIQDFRKFPQCAISKDGKAYFSCLSLGYFDSFKNIGKVKYIHLGWKSEGKCWYKGETWQEPVLLVCFYRKGFQRCCNITPMSYAGQWSCKRPSRVLRPITKLGQTQNLHLLPLVQLPIFQWQKWKNTDYGFLFNLFGHFS